MRILNFWHLLSAAALASAAHLPPRNYNTHDYYAIHLSPSTSPSELAAHLGLTYDGPLGSLVDHHLFKAPKHANDIVDDARQELKRRRRKREAGPEPHTLDSIQFTQKQKIKPRHVKRSVIPKDPQGVASPKAAIQLQRQIANTLEIKDPIFEEQWHIFNVKDTGNDLNVTDVWLSGITGKGATACIVDDGLDFESEDLKDNFYAQGSYDFNDHTDLPRPKLSDDRHGTRCAGEVAAGRNNACGVGIAYDAKISGVRILSGDITDADEALAINYDLQNNDIYSCSWGPPDDGKTMQKPGILIEKAMVTAVQKGRGGKGSIYVFAAGNGAAADDNCNFDGYTNSIYSITVGAIDKNNVHPYYSEACSAQLVVTYSSGGGDAIHTTDVGANTCTSQHGGTSAAGPIAVGTYALVLSARPELTWRDMQWLTVMTAVPFDQPSDWNKTSLGKMFSHQFGYGKLDAYAIVEAAKTWELVKPQAWFYSPWMHVKKPIPQGDQGLASVFEVTEEMLKKANFERVEHITLTMNIQHQRRGDLSVDLISPDGYVSHLSTARRDDEAAIGYEDWTFMSVAHWGEKGIGKWTVVVKDVKVNDKTGSFTDWKLRLWGESIDAEKAKLRPLPDEHDDDDHDVVDNHPAHTTSVVVPTATGAPGEKPSDHPDRPVNQKPSAATSSVSTTPASPTADASATASSAPENFLPSPFPTFGVSKRTQIWIYGALGLILIFCGSLAVYLYLARRKRLQSTRDNYEFEMLDDAEDDEGGARTGMLSNAAGGKKGKRARRGGELYDAFAGESDEDLLSDSGDEGPYRDREERDYNEKAGINEDSDTGGSSSSASSAGKRQ
ncbi:KEX1 protease precursor [Aaosphaeria arxii CBS 175.79]|uniref:KEX1 protease n=1 Tax=Aaosphaeria arxii CBS 175.79 TaxID=1450172 RepID=A0A6A5XKL5_9PLEO|nr:KEX1 protease precursor [Aaosphaeria arxii CBS 175.79]KAF2013391.1 KEX1 protease precursor [Aaosphaeria arxii CBS 175.79]